MLFQSMVGPIFEKLNIQADTAANLQRKEDTAKRLDFYHDQQLDHLETKLNELFSDPSTMVKASLNVVKKIINQLAQCYREPPVRTVEGSQKDENLYSEIAEGMALDVKMKQASRYAKLLKTILLRPVWRNDQLDLDILTGNILDVATGDTPQDLTQVLITDFGNSDNIEDVEYSFWTPETWQRLNYRGEVLEEEPNPYGVLPFLPVFDYAPTGSEFWLPGGDDIISIQEAVNLKIVDLLYLLSTQSFGVGWIKGTPGGGNLRVDPGSLVELPEEGALGFEAQKARILDVVESIDRLIKWACVSNGLSATSFTTQPYRDESGIAKRLDSAELNEKRRDDIALWRSYEKQLFNLIRIVHNTHSPGRKLSEQAILNIDFADPEQETDPKTQAETWEKLVGLGVANAVDIALERNPDLKTREDALAFLIQLQEEDRQLNPGGV